MKITKTVCTVLLAVVCIILAAQDSLAGRPGFDGKEIRIAQWGPQT